MKCKIPFLVFLSLIFAAGFAGASTIQLSFTTSDYNGYNVSCFGSQDGWIKVTASGGIPPYTFLWSNDSTTDSISGLSASYYSVSVMDSDSVIVEAGITLSTPSQLVVEITSPTYANRYNVSCFDCFNGSINSDVSGGVLPYRYVWNDLDTSVNRSGLGGGTYSLFISDGNACRDGQRIYLTEPSGGWGRSGNGGTDPITNFIGTTDSQDLVFKTDAEERMRIGADGKITTTDPVYWEKLMVNRISSFDTVVYIGDSTLIFNGGNQTIYGAASGTHKGLGLGNSQNICAGIGAVGIGIVSKANGDRSVSIGFGVSTSAEQAITIGSGISASSALDNGAANSLWIGFNSDIPTVVVTPSDGSGTTGNVGIGTATPSQKLEVEHDDAQGVSGGMVLRNMNADNRNSEIKFNHGSGDDPLWSVGNDLTHDGGQNFFVYDNTVNAPVGTVRFYIDGDGRVGINMIPPATSSLYKLFVDGGINTRDVMVQATGWQDYVLNKNYALMSIHDLKDYIEVNRHLPGIPSEKEIIENGYELGDMQQRLLKLTEEQALYIISLQKQLDEQKKAIEEMRAEVKRIKK